MESSLIVKAYLQREDEGQAEIRRFPLRTEMGQDKYKALKGRLTEVYPGLRAGGFSLHWKDEDGDLVKVCSQEELQQALNTVNDGVLRIFIMIDQDATAEESADMGGGRGQSEAEEAPATKRVRFEHPLSHPFHGRMWMHPPCQGHGKHFKKMKKMMKKEAKRMRKVGKKLVRAENEEFMILKSQVPPVFRSWVRQYVKVWFSAGHLAADKLEGIPEGAPPNFREWLITYLERFSDKQEAQAAGDADKNGMGQDEDLPAPPEGLPNNYFQWLRLFVKHFFARHTQDSSDSDTSDSDDHFVGAFWHHMGGYGPWHRHMHRFRHGHHWTKGKHRWGAFKSDHEGAEKQNLWQKISPEMRKYVRATMKNLHKGEQNKQVATNVIAPEGIRPEAVEFIQQFIMEWHAKLTSLPPRAVFVAMIQEHRTGLPAGIEEEHVQWLCRFLARWHRIHAAKCDAMAAWSSGDTSDDTSEDEQASDGTGPNEMYWPTEEHNRKSKKQHFGPARMPVPPFSGHHGMHMPRFHGMHMPPFHGMHMPPFHGMHHDFPTPHAPMMHPGMTPPFHCPPPFWGQMHHGMDAACPFGFSGPACGGREWCERGEQQQPHAGPRTSTSDQCAIQEDMVSKVTEAMKKM